MNFKSENQRKKVMSILNEGSCDTGRSKNKLNLSLDTEVVFNKKEKVIPVYTSGTGIWGLEVKFNNKDYEKHKKHIKNIIKDDFGLSKFDMQVNEWHLPNEKKFEERTIVVRRLIKGGVTSGLRVKGNKNLEEALLTGLKSFDVKFDRGDEEKETNLTVAIKNFIRKAEYRGFGKDFIDRWIINIKKDAKYFDDKRLIKYHSDILKVIDMNPDNKKLESEFRYVEKLKKKREI